VAIQIRTESAVGGVTLDGGGQIVKTVADVTAYIDNDLREVFPGDMRPQAQLTDATQTVYS
jgi:hypothetical protein